MSTNRISRLAPFGVAASSRAALGDAEYEEAVRVGEELSNEEAVELALGVSAV